MSPTSITEDEAAPVNTEALARARRDRILTWVMPILTLGAAIGAWIWPSQMIMAMVLTAMAGGIMALAWAVFGGFLGELFSGSGDLLFGWRERGLKPPSGMDLSNPKARKMPYAPAIAIGTLISFFSR